MSRTFHLHREQVIARPLERVFPFFERPENLALITPPSLGFRVLTPSPVPMAEGAVIDYRIRLGGLPVRWRSLISAYRPPHFFVDEQVMGPYRQWRHEHRFEPVEGGTRCVDDVYYRLPAPPPGAGALVRTLLVGPYLDKCNFFSLENGGGAHFHVAMLANMTYPFTEAHEWNIFAPRTLKQILIRSTNVLGYKPQPRNLMLRTGEMICEEYDVIRCFDFLNHVDNMYPFAEVALSGENKGNIWEPAISLSWAEGFTVAHYVKLAEEIVRMSAKDRCLPIQGGPHDDPGAEGHGRGLPAALHA